MYVCTCLFKTHVCVHVSVCTCVCTYVRVCVGVCVYVCARCVCLSVCILFGDLEKVQACNFSTNLTLNVLIFQVF